MSAALATIQADIATAVSTGPMLIAVGIAIAAGVVSFLSPCVVPLVPGYLSYVTGMAGFDLDDTRASRRRIALGTMSFVAGFTFVFVSYGALFGGLGQQLLRYERGVNIILGSVTIVLGLAFSGLLGRMPILSREFKLHRLPKAGLAGAPLLGVIFGLGWTPCIGPTLGAVNGLALESATAARGALLSLAYCIGLGLPFFLAGIAYRQALAAISAVRRHQRVVLSIGGMLLVALGVLEVTGIWTNLMSELRSSIGPVQSPL